MGQTKSAFLEEGNRHQSIEIVFKVHAYAVRHDDIPQDERHALNARLRAHDCVSRKSYSCKEAEAFIWSTMERALASEDEGFALEKTRIIAGAKDRSRPNTNFMRARVWSEPLDDYDNSFFEVREIFSYPKWHSILSQYKEPGIHNKLRVNVEVWPRWRAHQRRLAVAMAADPRLGADSPLRLLDKEVLGLILDELLE
jgi:hypothetical protein